MSTLRVAVKPAVTMKVAQISKPGGDFEFVERGIPEPNPGQVRIKVQACGVCHSDVFTKEGLWPGIQYPRVPGHEVVGVIDALGAAVSGWKKGQRAGVGWHGLCRLHQSVAARRVSEVSLPWPATCVSQAAKEAFCRSGKWGPVWCLEVAQWHGYRV